MKKRVKVKVTANSETGKNGTVQTVQSFFVTVHRDASRPEIIGRAVTDVASQGWPDDTKYQVEVF